MCLVTSCCCNTDEHEEFDERFCPSMFLYLMTIIPCHWTAKTQILDCVASSEACLQTINGSATLHQFFKGIRINIDERLLYTSEQALVLILVIGRWLLPKGEITRDQLSQLLLIYIGTGADIMEFTGIINEHDTRRTNTQMLQNKRFVNAVFLFWSVSLFQFSLTIFAMEGTAQRLEKEKLQLMIEELKKLKGLTRKRRNQVLPSQALYTNKMKHSKFGQEGNQVMYKQTEPGLVKPEIMSITIAEDEVITEASDRRCSGCWHRFAKSLGNVAVKVTDYAELTSLLIPLLMQDGPFLVIRLIVIAYYKVYLNGLYFLIVKNALVVMIQVYRIFVLYYKPPEEDNDDFFSDSYRLQNVQTAIQSVQNTRLAIRFASSLQDKAKLRRKFSKKRRLMQTENRIDQRKVDIPGR
ncbi:transmembrane protein 26-like isoform X3 [Acropora muricata]|uniref:transmembrane protein 26-like isoform X2 n=1 Tax=Acropora millepora TaxID=45264 RepID=UPI001CF55D42|nr:transmembrane protein 26-like isoform X2 [Acropora millepora]XP_044184359.1 transmembrane protein 26-like isoform X2 [Acropora millepora]